MHNKPTYEELEQRIAALQEENSTLRGVEKKLVESEEKFSALFEYASFVIHVVDVETAEPVLQNELFRDLMGHSMEEMIEKDLREGKCHFPPEEQLFKHFQEIIKKGSDIFERTFFSKDGELRTFLTNAVPIKIRGKWYIQNISFDVTEHNQTMKALKERETELEEVNAALKVLLRRRDEEKNEIENDFISGLDELIEPYLLALKNTEINQEQEAFIHTIEANLQQMRSPFIRGLSFKHSGFTHKERQIATFIRDGKTTKDIAESLSLSIRAIESHRANIRKKLGILNKKANLRELLLDQIK